MSQSTLTDFVPFYDPTWLPRDHALTQRMDTAIYSLAEVEMLLKKRLKTLGDRLGKILDALGGEDIDPSSEDTNIRRLSDLYVRGEVMLSSLQSRFFYVKKAGLALSEANCESHDRRRKAVMARRKRGQ